MTLFALTQASSREAGKRQVETKFRLSKSKGRTVTAMLVIGDDGRCQVEVRAHSREFIGRYSATIEVEFVSHTGQSIFSLQTPPVTVTTILGICLRGRLSHTFSIDPDVVKKTEKIRLTSGKEASTKNHNEDSSIESA